MLHLLLVLVPLGLAAAVSPVMLTEQSVLLAGPGGRRAGLLYAAGTASVLVVLVAAVLLLGRSLALPRAPHLSASLDLLVGAALVALAVLVHVRRHHRPARPRAHHGTGPARAYAFGLFSMATNVTTLGLVVAGAKEIAAGRLAAWERVLPAVLLVLVACTPAWGPVALVTAAPATARRLLDRLAGLIARRGRLLAALLLAAAGAFLLVRELVRLA